jgi:hypothetical protein
MHPLRNYALFVDHLEALAILGSIGHSASSHLARCTNTLISVHSEHRCSRRSTGSCPHNVPVLACSTHNICVSLYDDNEPYYGPRRSANVAAMEIAGIDQIMGQNTSSDNQACHRLVLCDIGTACTSVPDETKVVGLHGSMHLRLHSGRTVS